MPLSPEQARHLLDRLEAARGEALTLLDVPAVMTVGMLAGLARAEAIVKEIAEKEE